MKKIKGKYIAISMMIFLVMSVVVICGCGGKVSVEPSDDTPWNNGLYAIMETENGYYSNLMYTQNLHFYEKGTGTEIYLCGKPECPHDGRESCTATYKNMTTVNSVLYDGAIYILTTEEDDETVSYNLYRAAPDGSAIDKVGEVFRAERLLGEAVEYEVVTTTGEPTPFIIHRGYAYIPYYVKLPRTQIVFQGGGIMKMDLKTGQTEQIYKMKLSDDPYPWMLAGCGDYVYFYCYNRKEGYRRYDTRDGSVTYLDEKELFGGENGEKVEAFTVDTLYVSTISGEEQDGKYVIKGWSLHAYDSETMEYLGLVLEGKSYRNFKVVPYEDMLFLYYGDRIRIYSKAGELLGEMAYEFPGFETFGILASGEPEPLVYYPYEYMFNIKVSQGKFYAVLGYYLYYNQEKDCDVYSCPIQDILDGKGEWSHVYSVKNLLGLKGEHYSGPRRSGGQVFFDGSHVTITRPAY